MILCFTSLRGLRDAKGRVESRTPALSVRIAHGTPTTTGPRLNDGTARDAGLATLLRVVVSRVPVAPILVLSGSALREWRRRQFYPIGPKFLDRRSSPGSELFALFAVARARIDGGVW